MLYLVKADMGKQIVLEVGWGLFTRNKGMEYKRDLFSIGAHCLSPHSPPWERWVAEGRSSRAWSRAPCLKVAWGTHPSLLTSSEKRQSHLVLISLRQEVWKATTRPASLPRVVVALGHAHSTVMQPQAAARLPHGPLPTPISQAHHLSHATLWDRKRDDILRPPPQMPCGGSPFSTGSTQGHSSALKVSGIISLHPYPQGLFPICYLTEA